MDLLGKIRRWHYRDNISIREIAAKTSLSRNTVRKYLRDKTITPDYPVRRPAPTKLDAYVGQLNAWLAEDERLPRKQRRSRVQLMAALKALGYAGSYGRVAAYIRERERAGGAPSSSVFIPLAFAPGEAFQFDFSTETVEIGGQVQTIKVAHIRLCYSRRFLVVAYPRETQEMVFDAHWRAFQYFGGVPRRGIYDNMSTAVDKVLAGRERDYNRRFEHMTAHYLFEPQACNVASGWEKGQVERQVALVRQWLFVPRARFATLALLNAWLAERCMAIALESRHPDQHGRTIEEVFQGDERLVLNPVPVMFDGFHERICRVSPSSLIVFERNRYSVHCAWVNQAVAVRAYADHIKVVAEGNVIAEHPRQFQGNVTLYNPWHYLPALERKPGALRNGAPFVDWELPPSIAKVQSRLTRLPGGERQFVTILSAIPIDGLEAVAVACELALEANVITSDYVLNVLSRFKPQQQVTSLKLPESLQLKDEPQANTARYDSLLKGCSVKSTVMAMAAAMLAAQTMLEVSHGAA